MTDSEMAKALLTDNLCSICKYRIKYENVGGYILESECVSKKLSGGKGCNNWKEDDGKRYVMVE